MTAYYPLGDRVPGSFAATMSVMGAEYKAKATDEYRPPKKGEWYLSGAIVAAYLAPNDLTQSFRIAKIMRVRKVEYWEEV